MKLTFDEDLGVGVLGHVVGVDEGGVLGIHGAEADRAPGARVQQHREHRDAVLARRLPVNRIPRLRSNDRESALVLCLFLSDSSCVPQGHTT